MSGYGQGKVQISFGECPPQGRITLSGASFSGTQISGLSGLTADKYNGETAYVIGGTNAGTIYHVVDMATTTIDMEEDVTDLSTDSVLVFTSRFTRPSDTSKFLAVRDDMDFPDEVHDIDEINAHGTGPDRHLAVTKAIDMDASFPTVVQDPRFFFHLLGMESCTGTDVAGGGGSTLSAAIKAGETTITIASGTNYANNDYIQIDTGSDAEVRKISSGGGTTTLVLDFPLRRDHANGVACNEVEAPYTHTMIPNDDFPMFNGPTYICLEGVYDEATDLVRHAIGLRMADGEFKSGSDGVLMFTPNFMGLKTTVNGASKSSVTSTSTAPYQYHMTSGITLNSVTYLAMTEFSYKLNWDLQKQRFHNDSSSRKPFDFYVGQRRHSCKIKIMASNQNLRNLVVNETKFSASLVFTRTASTDTLTFNFATCRAKAAPYNYPSKGTVISELDVIPNTLTSIVAVDSIPYY